MTTSAHSSHSRVQLTLFAEASPARTSARPVPVPASVKAPAQGSSTNSCVSFAWWDRDSSSWRTSQRSLIEGWTSFSENWPKQGLMRSGHVFRRVLWAPATGGTAGGLLPTPRAQEPGRTNKGYGDSVMERVCLQMGVPTQNHPLLPTPAACVANDGERPETWLARRERVKAKGINGNGMGMPLTIAAQLLPTPTVNDAGNSTLPPSQRGRDSLPGQMLRDDSIQTGGTTYLNPSFVTEMMGYPIEWLD